MVHGLVARATEPNMPLLTATNLTKTYSGIRALDAVNFELRAGEVHALVGENGAGKSTLCRILCGITPPDSGSMQLKDLAYFPGSRRDAASAGARMVMQELNLLPTLTVAENLFLDAMPRRMGVVDYRAMNRAAADALAGVGLHSVRPDQLLGTLGVGQCQLVEIAAALARRCDVLMLDEPTAALTSAETEILFARIQQLKAQGVGLIYVSHRMEEIRAIADRITILRDGRHVATRAMSEITHEEIIRLMVGREIGSGQERRAQSQQRREVLMSVRNLSAGKLVRDVNFQAHRGEIFGIAGLMGSGRTETLRAIFGADRATRGEINLRCKSVRVNSPRDAVRHGIALLTEDRKGQGLLLPFSIATNTTLAKLPAVSRFGWINRARETQVADTYIDKLATRCRSGAQPVGTLSGGNQQKVVLAKWLLRDCDVLMIDEPTRGIDVGAKFEIYSLLADLAAAGKAIIVVSSDLLELLAICDRIAVMSAGRLVNTFERNQCSQELIMQAALSGYSTAAQ